jgi:1-acyl-sn-glycerol-3-phosphate acyltransferase
VLRILLVLPLIAGATLVFGLLSLLFGALDRSGGLCHSLARTWSRLLLWGLGVTVSVEGAGEVPRGAVVFAANHGSALDVLILFGHLPASFRFIHKRSLYWIPMIGWTLWLAGHIGIDRASPFRARRSLERAARRVHGGTSVVVFPEGTRSPDGTLRLFKRGSFVLAIEAGAPVVPVSLAGVKTVVPRGLATLRPGTVRLKIHPAVPTEGRATDAAEALAEEVRKVVAKGLEAAA